MKVSDYINEAIELDTTLTEATFKGSKTIDKLHSKIESIKKDIDTNIRAMMKILNPYSGYIEELDIPELSKWIGAEYNTAMKHLMHGKITLYGVCGEYVDNWYHRSVAKSSAEQEAFDFLDAWFKSSNDLKLSVYSGNATLSGSIKDVMNFLNSGGDNYMFYF